MKKNVMMRIASVLLICVLVTTCGISGTFAKYVTQASGSDEARVAKWGVTVTATGSLFSEQYVNAAGGNKPGSVDLTVKGSEKVVAPGTQSPDDGVTFAIAGDPEVNVDVNVTVSLVLSGWKNTADWDGIPGNPETEEEYCPLVFTVGTKTYYIDTTPDSDDTTVECDNVADLRSKVEAAIIAELKKTNVDTETSIADTLTIKWSWPFNGDDVKDTALGNLAAAGKAPTIDFDMTVTVEQVD